MNCVRCKNDTLWHVDGNCLACIRETLRDTAKFKLVVCQKCQFIHDGECPMLRPGNHQFKERRANGRQVGGEHYKTGDFQVWDAWHHWKLNPFQAVVLKYVVRYRNKGGVEDLRKAIHYLEKLIELEDATPE